MQSACCVWARAAAAQFSPEASQLLLESTAASPQAQAPLRTSPMQDPMHATLAARAPAPTAVGCTAAASGSFPQLPAACQLATAAQHSQPHVTCQPPRHPHHTCNNACRHSSARAAVPVSAHRSAVSAHAPCPLAPQQPIISPSNWNSMYNMP